MSLPPFVSAVVATYVIKIDKCLSAVCESRPISGSDFGVDITPASRHLGLSHNWLLRRVTLQGKRPKYKGKHYPAWVSYHPSHYSLIDTSKQLGPPRV